MLVSTRNGKASIWNGTFSLPSGIDSHIMYDKIDRMHMHKYAYGYFPEERNDNE